MDGNPSHRPDIPAPPLPHCRHAWKQALVLWRCKKIQRFYCFGRRYIRFHHKSHSLDPHTVLDTIEILRNRDFCESRDFVHNALHEALESLDVAFQTGSSPSPLLHL
jgi:hypothetical protein